MSQKWARTARELPNARKIAREPPRSQPQRNRTDQLAISNRRKAIDISGGPEHRAYRPVLCSPAADRLPSLSRHIEPYARVRGFR
jgi:hypothetical protein